MLTTKKLNKLAMKITLKRWSLNGPAGRARPINYLGYADYLRSFYLHKPKLIL